jgi:hypothetical protein
MPEPKLTEAQEAYLRERALESLGQAMSCLRDDKEASADASMALLLIDAWQGGHPGTDWETVAEVLEEMPTPEDLGALRTFDPSAEEPPELFNRLLDHGWVESHWEYYRNGRSELFHVVTPAGKAALEAHRNGR